MLIVGGWVPVGLGLRLGLDLGSGEAVGLRPALGHNYVLHVDASIAHHLSGIARYLYHVHIGINFNIKSPIGDS